MTSHLLAPVSDPSDVAALIDAGATRLYCGVAPRAWSQRYTRAVWLSRRGPSANLPDLESLARVTDLARRRGAGVHLALNAPSLTGEQVEMVAGLARRAVGELGVEAVIAADTSLMLALGELAVPFVASTVAVAHNSEALRFFRDLGAVAAVLPRHLRFDEIARISGEVPDLELESLVLFDGCPWEEGLCRTVHEVGPTSAFCRTGWTALVEPVPGRAPDADALTGAFRAWREWTYWADACGSPVTDRGVPNGACGLCALYPLARSGVRVFKLGGRQSPIERRVRGTQMVRRVLDASDQGPDLARAIRATPDLCDSGAMCYYPQPRGR
ncbi:MAG: U32 family peptidase [Deltaproteobacteria bacterium]|nr:U32 family peptidase [Deltaproteobacteria bacterium]